MSGRTRVRVTRRMAPVPARQASGASGARTVSAGTWGVGPGGVGRTLQAPLPSPAECRLGFFGPGCLQTCTCPPGVACDPISGECGKECPAGYRGKDCGQGEWLPGARGLGGVWVLWPVQGVGTRAAASWRLSQPCSLTLVAP